MPLSNYEKRRRLIAFWCTTAYTKPGTIYIGLFSSAPNAGGGGSEFVIGFNAYARASVDTIDANFAEPALGSPVTNAGSISFPAPTGAWGTATHWAAFDAATAGNMYEFGELTGPLVISGAGPAPVCPAGSLIIDSN